MPLNISGGEWRYSTTTNTVYVPSYPGSWINANPSYTGSWINTNPFNNTGSGINTNPFNDIVPQTYLDIDWEDLTHRAEEQIIFERIALGLDKPVLRKPLRMIRLREDAEG